jgi:hypothetical protein
MRAWLVQAWTSSQRDGGAKSGRALVARSRGSSTLKRRARAVLHMHAVLVESAEDIPHSARRGPAPLNGGGTCFVENAVLSHVGRRC